MDASACPGLRVSEDLTLRLLGPADAIQLYSLIEAERPRLEPWLPWASGQTFADTAEFIASSRREATAGRSLQTAAIARGEIAGMVGVPTIDWTLRIAAIGYWLGRRWLGRGIVTAAAGALAEHALCTWELNRVEIRVAVENERSRAVPERLGFTQEWIEPAAQRVGERELDLVVYASCRSTD